jgi:hypothetical protein
MTITGLTVLVPPVKQITVQHLNVIFLVLVMAIYKKAFTFVGFGSCLGVSRSTGVSGLVLILNTTNTSGVAPPLVGVISKMTSFADLVKNGVLMIIPIYAKVSFNNRIKNENNNNGITLLVFKSNLRFI